MTTIAKGGNLADRRPRPSAPSCRGPAARACPTSTPRRCCSRTTGKVAGDDDFVFFNQPRHPSGAVRHARQAAAASTPSRSTSRALPAVGRAGRARGVRRRRHVRPGARPAAGASRTLGTGAELADFVMDGARRDGVPQRRAVPAQRRSGSSARSGRATPPAWPASPPTSASRSTTRRRHHRAPLPTRRRSARRRPPRPPPPPPPGTRCRAPPPPAAPLPAPARPPPVNLDKGRVNLTKGARVSLVKTGAPAAGQVTMGLGWDPARGRKNIDLDASCIAFDRTGKQARIVWFTHLKDFGGALQHAGDNMTGRGDGDDEQIHVDLQRPAPDVASLVFTINSFRGQKFTDVANAFCRLVEAASGPSSSASTCPSPSRATRRADGDAATPARRQLGDARDRRVPRRPDGQEARRARRAALGRRMP